MPKQNYDPGLHILCTFRASHAKLTNAGNCEAFFNTLIYDTGLQKVGEVYHAFDNGGFTAVICLVESHISIHTWPEFELATFDVFLSNFNNDNSDKAKLIHSRTIEFFDAIEINTQEVLR